MSMESNISFSIEFKLVNNRFSFLRQIAINTRTITFTLLLLHMIYSINVLSNICIDSSQSFVHISIFKLLFLNKQKNEKK